MILSLATLLVRTELPAVMAPEAPSSSKAPYRPLYGLHMRLVVFVLSFPLSFPGAFAGGAFDDERWAKSRAHSGERQKVDVSFLARQQAANTSFFLQLGEQKCGTSSLFNIVSKHPRVGLITRYKEPHFWTRVVRTEWLDGECALVVGEAHVNLSSLDSSDELRANLELTRRAYLGNLWAVEESAVHGLVRSSKARVRRTHYGDFSATNLLCVCCPDLVARFMPSARLYAVLRNPVKRVISRAAEGSWNALSGHDDRAQTIDSRLGVAVPPELRAMRACLGAITGDRVRERVACASQFGYVGRGDYSASLANWEARGGDVHIVFLEQLRTLAGARDALKAVIAHLGLTAHRYDQELLTSVFNPSSCVSTHPGWQRKCNETPSVDITEAVHARNATWSRELAAFYMEQDPVLNGRWFGANPIFPG